MSTIQTITCPNCGGSGTIQIHIWPEYPKLHTGPRPESEHASAQTPSEWNDQQHSDNLSTREGKKSDL
jgi:hypothetical protein